MVFGGVLLFPLLSAPAPRAWSDIRPGPARSPLTPPFSCPPGVAFQISERRQKLIEGVLSPRKAQHQPNRGRAEEEEDELEDGADPAGSDVDEELGMFLDLGGSKEQVTSLPVVPSGDRPEDIKDLLGRL